MAEGLRFPELRMPAAGRQPVEILRTLPEEYHAQFLAGYDTAIQRARRPEQLRQLHELLRL
jgi:hypothetical protein